jgi:tryptophanyl-tRNA synthetase
MRAVTDSGPVDTGAPMSEPVQNLFTILQIVSDNETVQFYREKYKAGEIRYGDMKKQLADDICKVTLPIRERILEIKSNDKYLAETVKYGAEKARASAAKTLQGVKEIMGFKWL